MRILNMQLLAILAVTGFVAGSVSNVSADDRTPAIQTGIEQVGHKTGGGGEYYCPPGSSGRYDGGGSYRYYGTREGWAFLRKHKSHGPAWCPPSAQMIQRTPVQYQRYYSNQYMGQRGPTGAANYQQIYMPTDTTQLGFYYQSVPTWQPRRGMLPPAPDPSMYHTRNCNSCKGHGCKYCRGHQAGGPVYYSTGNPGTPQPEVAPKQQNATPPVPPAPSKLNQASFQK
ncbi:MAG: hypothetical protein P1V19_00450 [Gimesia sp.]|nr:hypothetical protein [Gimesia sp.]